MIRRGASPRETVLRCNEGRRGAAEHDFPRYTSIRELRDRVAGSSESFEGRAGGRG